MWPGWVRVAIARCGRPCARELDGNGQSCGESAEMIATDAALSSARGLPAATFTPSGPRVFRRKRRGAGGFPRRRPGSR